MHIQLNIALIFLASVASYGQAPARFRWVDFKNDSSTLTQVENALKGESYSAIREIGVMGEFALVMTAYREPGQPTPSGDQWNVYSVSMKTSAISRLISGYNLEIKDWISFRSGIPDLGVVYLDCWECEPGSLFTALHCDPQEGWRARWIHKEDTSLPGITLGVTDVGDPYTDEEVDQVFAVLAPLNGTVSVGTWYHSRDLTSGKITDTASKFSVEPGSGNDKSEVLHGLDAVNWEMRLCTAKDTLPELFGGQSSDSCKKIVGERSKRSKSNYRKK